MDDVTKVRFGCDPPETHGRGVSGEGFPLRRCPLKRVPSRAQSLRRVHAQGCTGVRPVPECAVPPDGEISAPGVPGGLNRGVQIRSLKEDLVLEKVGCTSVLLLPRDPTVVAAGPLSRGWGRAKGARGGRRRLPSAGSGVSGRAGVGG